MIGIARFSAIFSLRSGGDGLACTTREQRICQTSTGQGWQPQRFGEHHLPARPPTDRRRHSGRPLIEQAPGMGIADVALVELIEGKMDFEISTATEEEAQPAPKKRRRG